MHKISSLKSAEPFVVMAKPVGSLCNLSCEYCYYLETGPGGLGGRMSEETLETYIRQYIEGNPGPAIQFTWHGGEPALAGLDFYRLAVQLQKKYLPEGWTCWNNLQTNGILLDDEWCRFLAEEKFDVGISIDGTQWIHDRYRKDRGGGGTYDKVYEAVKRLQKHGIRPDLLCTVTSDTAKEPDAVYRALKGLGTGWIQFIPIIRLDSEGRVTGDSVAGRAYGDFLCAVFDNWVYSDIGSVEVQLFAEVAMVWGGGAASLCWMAPVCGRVLIVEQDGGVYSCDHFVRPEYLIGNVENAQLAGLVDSDFQRTFGRDKRDRLPGSCLACEWLSVCNGGCPKDRFVSDSNGEQGLNFLCDGFKRFFAHAERPVKRTLQLRKQGLTAERIMNELRAEAREKWRGVGRNDPCPCGSGKKAKSCCWSRKP